MKAGHTYLVNYDVTVSTDSSSTGAVPIGLALNGSSVPGSIVAGQDQGMYRLAGTAIVAVPQGTTSSTLTLNLLNAGTKAVTDPDTYGRVARMTILPLN